MSFSMKLKAWRVLRQREIRIRQSKIQFAVSN